ncbi:class I SAM-dependent methyltransferase [uncultured Jatrophihabitans sp.]|uniref:class I SAM-dependent methyltransferase n=1 Tax=uncultured Jatrophihabitans sp. TaxID=1610747 RepID=UPI0035CBF81A
MSNGWDADEWDARYAASTSVWGGAPNRWVEQEVRDLPPARALDLACGEGRNAIWLATRGWHVVAVDFSAVALDKGRAAEPPDAGIEWISADATTYEVDQPVDLALLCYLQLPAPLRAAAVQHAARALDPGGVLLVIAHDSRNLVDGTGGPQDPAVLYTAAEVMNDLAGTDLELEKAEEVLRPVENAERPAIDALLRVRRPS